LFRTAEQFQPSRVAVIDSGAKRHRDNDAFRHPSHAVSTAQLGEPTPPIVQSGGVRPVDVARPVAGAAMSQKARLSSLRLNGPDPARQTRTWIRLVDAVD